MEVGAAYVRFDEISACYCAVAVMGFTGVYAARQAQAVSLCQAFDLRHGRHGSAGGDKLLCHRAFVEIAG